MEEKNQKQSANKIFAMDPPDEAALRKRQARFERPQGKKKNQKYTFKIRKYVDDGRTFTPT